MRDSLQNIKEEKLISLEDLKWIWSAIVKGWYLFILMPVIVGAVGFFYSYRITPEYSAKIQILLKSNDVYDYQSSIQKSVGYAQSYTDIRTQQRILSSYDLIERTLSKLDFDISYYIVGRVNTKEFFENMPFHVDMEVINNGIYEIPIEIKIIDEETFALEFMLRNSKVIRQHKFNETVITNEYIIEVESSDRINKASVANLAHINYRIKAHAKSYWVGRIMSGMTINNLEYTSILDITLTDEVPQRAKMFLDTLALEYIDYTLTSEFTVNDNTLEYINRQLDEVVEVLDSIELEVDSVREDKGILDLSKESSAYFSQMVTAESILKGLQLDLQSIDNLKNYIINTKEDNLLPPSFYVLKNDVYLAKALSEFYNGQIARVNLKYDVKEGHMGLAKLDEKMNLQRIDILTYIENTKIAIEEKIEEVKLQLYYYEGLVKKIPKSQSDMLSIARRMQVNEKLYMYLLEKRANTYIAKSGIVPQTKVIEKARIGGLVSKNKDSVLLMFVIIGLVLAGVFSLLKYLWYHTFENSKELAQNTSIPLLGSLPFVGEEELKSGVLQSSKSNIIEALRGIRTSLSYMNVNGESKVLLVTSIHPGEGKTFTSNNLASIYARSGKKVVLIDFDLHKPKVHKVLNLDNVYWKFGLLIREYSD